MNIVNKVKVTICGKEFNLQTDETPEYLIDLAKRVDKEINDLVKAKPNFGVQNAAVFVALTSLDEARKASDSIGNTRTQINNYISEAARAREAKDRMAEKVKELEEKIAALEAENKALKKCPPAYDCEQLVLENTIPSTVTIFAEEASSKEETVQKAEKPAPEAEQITLDMADASSEKKSTKSAENGSDASKSEKVSEENSGNDGGTGAEAANDGSNTQNDDVTPPPSKKGRKKRRGN